MTDHWRKTVAEALAAANIDSVTSLSIDEVTAHVPATSWTNAIATARDSLHLTFFDWLSAVDDMDDGFKVVIHLYDPVAHVRLLLRTTVSKASPELATATALFRGAAWHERETYEMFGIDFVGHPYLVPLLLPDGFEGHPLRKEFVLAARAAKQWPGAKEPGESDADAAPGRRKVRPPGVPDPALWGDRAVANPEPS